MSTNDERVGQVMREPERRAGMSTTSDITARMLFTGANILVHHPHGLRFRELWPLVLEQLPGVEQEWATARTGTTTADRNFNWYSVSLVKAGWIYKTGRRWYLTGIGRKAIEDYPDPESFFRAGAECYAYWDGNKQSFELAKRLVE